MDTNLEVLMNAAIALLQEHHIPAEGVEEKGKILKAKTAFYFSRPCVHFELYVGAFKHATYLPIQDERIFCEAILIILQTLRRWTDPAKIAILRGADGSKSYLLEIPLLYSADAVALLSLVLKTEHYNQQYLARVVEFNGMSPLETHFMFAEATNGVQVFFMPLDPGQVPLTGKITRIQGREACIGPVITRANITIEGKTFEACNIMTFSNNSM